MIEFNVNVAPMDERPAGNRLRQAGTACAWPVSLWTLTCSYAPAMQLCSQLTHYEAGLRFVVLL